MASETLEITSASKGLCSFQVTPEVLDRITTQGIRGDIQFVDTAGKEHSFSEDDVLVVRGTTTPQ